MSDSDSVVTGGERLRALLASERGGPSAPRPEWAYRRDLGPVAVLTDLWRSRPIVRTLTERDLRVRYKQSVLGFTWAVLTPLGLLVAFVIVLHRGVRVDSGGVPYPLFAFIGLVPWTFFATSINLGGNSVLNDKALLSKAQFPREVFPFSGVAVAAVDAVMCLVPLAVLFAVHGRAPAGTSWLAALPLLVLICWTAGLTLLLSALIVHLRDTRLALPLILQIGLFATPVGYGMELIPAHLRLVYSFVNPLAPVIDALRRTVLMDDVPDWSTLGAAACTAGLTLIGGYVVFKRLEGTFADVA